MSQAVAYKRLKKYIKLQNVQLQKGSQSVRIGFNRRVLTGKIFVF